MRRDEQIVGAIAELFPEGLDLGDARAWRGLNERLAVLRSVPMRTVYVAPWGLTDPGNFLPGAVFEASDTIARLRQIGRPLLPVDADLVEQPPSGADGWACRSFGHGQAPSKHVPSRVCPIAIRIEPERRFVHWVVELAKGSGERAGSLRVGFDTTQRGTIAPAASAHGGPIDVAALSLDWEDETAIVLGVLPVDVRVEGMLGLALYGAATGVLVRRVAVSVCSSEG